MKSFKMIWVLGGPGAGKGTLCEKIAEKYNFLHISSGELLRQEAQNNPTLNDIMIRGDFVSHDLVLDLLKKEINANQNNTNGFLIDGSPRERQQSIDLEKKLVPVDLILLFDASEATLLKRLLNRTKSSARVDDNEETIRKRLAMYKKNNCEFVVELYPYKYKRIDVERDVDTIFKEISIYIDKLI